MFFTDFKNERPDNKQRLNLSEHAYQTLISDASVFFPKKSHGQKAAAFLPASSTVFSSISPPLQNPPLPLPWGATELNWSRPWLI